jgi:membrane-associated protease RseP (regulator of RpoE activity)
MNPGTLSLIASLAGTLGFVPIVGQIIGIWLGKKALREGTDNGLAKVGIVIGWAGLVVQVLLTCAFLGLVALGVMSNLSAESPDIAPPSVAEPGTGPGAGPVVVEPTFEPSDSPAIPTVASSSPALLGVECEDVDNGARVTRVVPGTPAEQAGLEVGDVIIAVDDHWVASCADLRSEIRTRSAGDEVKISFRRGNETTRVTVVLAGR